MNHEFSVFNFSQVDVSGRSIISIYRDSTPVDWDFYQFYSSKYWEKALADLKAELAKLKTEKEERARVRLEKMQTAPGPKKAT